MTADSDEVPRIDVEYDGAYGRETIKDADPLDEFAFERGDRFVRWSPWGDRPENDDLYVITDVSWRYTVSWLRERDSIPLPEDHREYTLMSRETLSETTITERELQAGEWKNVSEDDDV